MIKIGWGSFTLTDNEAQQFLSLFGISGDFLHIWDIGSSWGIRIKKNGTTILSADYDYDGEREDVNELDVSPERLKDDMLELLTNLQVNVDGLKNVNTVFNTMLFSKNSIKISVDDITKILKKKELDKEFIEAIKEKIREILSELINSKKIKLINLETDEQITEKIEKIELEILREECFDKSDKNIVIHIDYVTVDFKIYTKNKVYDFISNEYNEFSETIEVSDKQVEIVFPTEILVLPLQ